MIKYSSELAMGIFARTVNLLGKRIGERSASFSSELKNESDSGVLKHDCTEPAMNACAHTEAVRIGCIIKHHMKGVM